MVKKMKEISLCGGLKSISGAIILSVLMNLMACGDQKNEEKAPLPVKEEKIEEKNEPAVPITFEAISGSWELKYPNHYGYTFKFYKNYRAVIILYLNNHSLVFKGVYTFEGKNMVRINIYEMKKSRKTSGINMSSGFVKAKSSYFIFTANLKKRGRVNSFWSAPGV